MPGQAFPPCCASNWMGTPSPALPATGDIPDGIYNARRDSWDPASAQLRIVVRRLEDCALLPETSCEQPPQGYQFQGDELGVDGTVTRPLAITLDSSVRVVVIGADSGNDRLAREAGGGDLATLLVDVQRAYDDVIAAPFATGVDPDAIIDGLIAAPAAGFGPPPIEMYRTLAYRHRDAPVLLFQEVFHYTDAGERVVRDPTLVANLTAIAFDHGLPTLYFYAGYYS